MSGIGNPVFYIGQWRVNSALDEISRDGSTVKLEPRTMRVLVCLAEHAGEVVSVDQLLDTVWKDLVVTQYSVYQAVAVLRRALGDNPKDPIYIANVVRRGYRLVSPVKVDAQTQDPGRPSVELASGTDPDEPDISATDADGRVPSIPSTGSHRGERRIGLRYGLILIVLLLVASTVVWLTPRRGRERPTPAVGAETNGAISREVRPPASFNPPPNSIAVLPFVNLSGDPSQQYFSDGLTEELLNSLSRIDELQVAARTSSFSFQGEHLDIATVAHKLNVASVLEGSVRRSGNTIRVTAQLNNALTGFHLWSDSYDRDLGDILKLQTDIANAVAGALKVRLLGNLAEKIELGGTHNPAAFDAYLRGTKALASLTDAKVFKAAIAEYSDAIRVDPNYALAFAGRSRAHTFYAGVVNGEAIRRASYDKGLADAQTAIRLAPELAQSHLALALYFELGALDFNRAREAYERALALAPGNARVLRVSGSFLVPMGQFDEGISAARRAVALDPLNRSSHDALGYGLYLARRFRESIRAYADSITLDPDYQEAYAVGGLAYFGLDDLANARASCETKPDYWASQQCLALVYDKLGRHADAESYFAKYRATQGDGGAYQYATIYAQWGNTQKALDWLDTALQLRDPGLEYLKTDPLMDPLRKEPRFQAVERALKFPD